MIPPNPDTPPNAVLADARPVKIELPQYVFAALIVMQFLATLRYSEIYFELALTGAVPFLALFLAVPASVCLYAAAIFMLLRGSRGKRLFLLAAVGLALTVPLWGWPSVWSVVAAFGAALGVAGWWIARRSTGTHQPPESHTTMSELSWLQRRPISVLIISTLCSLSFVGTAVFILNNGTDFEALPPTAPLALPTKLLYPLLYISGGLLLLLMRKEAIVLFVLYFVWGLGKTIYENVTFLNYLDLVLVFGFIIYCLRLRQRNLLR